MAHELLCYNPTPDHCTNQQVSFCYILKMKCLVWHTHILVRNSNLSPVLNTFKLLASHQLPYGYSCFRGERWICLIIEIAIEPAFVQSPKKFVKYTVSSDAGFEPVSSWRLLIKLFSMMYISGLCFHAASWVIQNRTPCAQQCLTGNAIALTHPCVEFRIATSEENEMMRLVHTSLNGLSCSICIEAFVCI